MGRGYEEGRGGGRGGEEVEGCVCVGGGVRGEEIQGGILEQGEKRDSAAETRACPK